jgi:hypothetical protein
MECLAEGLAECVTCLNREAKETKLDGTGGRKSEHCILPMKQGNSSRE